MFFGILLPVSIRAGESSIRRDFSSFYAFHSELIESLSSLLCRTSGRFRMRRSMRRVFGPPYEPVTGSRCLSECLTQERSS